MENSRPDHKTAILVQSNNETAAMLDCVSMQNMHMTSPCQSGVTYQPLGIEGYFNAKIIFCSSDQKDWALLIAVSLILLFSFVIRP